MDNIYNIQLNCKGKCPKCKKGEMYPFLNAISNQRDGYTEGVDAKLDHYEVYYECPMCHHRFEGKGEDEER